MPKASPKPARGAKKGGPRRPARARKRAAQKPGESLQILAVEQHQDTVDNNGRTTEGKFSPGNRLGFQPGQSGNPGGRPRRLLSDAYRAKLAEPAVGDKDGRTYAEVIAASLVLQAMKGQLNPAIELRRATEGDVVRLDVASEAQHRMEELGLTEEDVWIRDPALGEYLASIGAIRVRQVAPGPAEESAGQSAEPGGPGPAAAA